MNSQRKTAIARGQNSGVWRLPSVALGRRRVRRTAFAPGATVGRPSLVPCSSLSVVGAVTAKVELDDTNWTDTWKGSAAITRLVKPISTTTKIWQVWIFFILCAGNAAGIQIYCFRVHGSQLNPINNGNQTNLLNRRTVNHDNLPVNLRVYQFSASSSK